MKRVLLLAGVAVCSVLGLLTAEFAAAADAPGGPSGPADQIVGESRSRVKRPRPRRSRVVSGHSGQTIQMASSCSGFSIGTPVSLHPVRLPGVRPPTSM